MEFPQFSNVTAMTSLSSLKDKLQVSTYQWLDRFNIGTKIGLGYGLALGVSILGTLSGLLISHHIQQQAKLEQDTADLKLELAQEFKLALLSVRSRELQLSTLLTQPELLAVKQSLLRDRIDRLEALLLRFQIFLHQRYTHDRHGAVADDMAILLAQNEQTVNTYLTELEALLEAATASVNGLTARTTDSAAPAMTPESLTAAVHERLHDFAVSPTAQRLDQFTETFKALVANARIQREAAQKKLAAVEQLRWQIIAGSMVLSGAIAILLAVYVSRAIARPLAVVTAIAQRSTTEANFDLQVPVTTADEVGILAHSLNNLIHRVKTLLEEQRAAARRQQEMQQEQLVQSEKMSSLGRMLAGVAHEINNPVNFLYGNLSHAGDYVDDLLAHLEAYREAIPQPPQSVRNHAEDIDLEFLQADLPKLLQSMKVGADRTRQIVLSLKNFSRLDDAAAHPVNLVECLDSTLLILNNRIKKGVAIERQYQDVPLIEGYSGLLYQVFMNLLSNALDALDEAIAKAQSMNSSSSSTQAAFQPCIAIALERDGAERVLVKIKDNGCGIPPENLQKIFEIFFTTKPIGVGTGLGLAITRQIVVEKHGGTIHCVSEPGSGTEFTIALPIRHAALSKAEPSDTLAPAQTALQVPA